MKGIQLLENTNGQKSHLLIDLQTHDKRINDILEDIEDLLFYEKVKHEKTISFEMAIKDLHKKKKLNDAQYRNLMKTKYVQNNI